MKQYIFVIVCLLSLRTARACDACQCWVNSGQLGFSVGINYRYSAFSRVLGAPNQTNYRLGFSKILHGGDNLLSGSSEYYNAWNVISTYRISSRWSAAVLIPLYFRSSKSIMTDQVEHDKTSGLGDISTSFQWNVISNSAPDHELTVGLLVGIKIPTGKSNFRTSGVYSDIHLQPGSGSFDYLVGASGSKRINRIEMQSDFMYRFNTEGVRLHEFGDFVNYRVGSMIDLNKHSNMLELAPQKKLLWTVGFFVEGEWQGRELVKGAIVSNTGSHTVALAPQVKIRWSNYDFQVGIQKPVWQRVTGRQIIMNSRLTTEFKVFL